MAELITFLPIFAVSLYILYRFRKRLNVLLVAVVAFFIAIIPSSFFPNEKEAVLSSTDKLIENFLSRLNFINSSLFVLLILLSLYVIGTVKIVKEGNAALVERLGRYRGTLEPGLNLVIPFLDVIVLNDSLSERTLEIEPQLAITRDNVSVTVEALIYWRVYNLERAYYECIPVMQ